MELNSIDLPPHKYTSAPDSPVCLSSVMNTQVEALFEVLIYSLQNRGNFFTNQIHTIYVVDNYFCTYISNFKLQIAPKNKIVEIDFKRSHKPRNIRVAIRYNVPRKKDFQIKPFHQRTPVTQKCYAVVLNLSWMGSTFMTWTYFVFNKMGQIYKLCHN